MKIFTHWMLFFAITILGSHSAWAKFNSWMTAVDQDADEIIAQIPDSELTEAMLLLAAEKGNAGLVRRCLAHGISPDARDEQWYNFTPAHYAVYEERNEVLDILIEWNADLSAKIDAGSSRFAGLTVWNLALHTNNEYALEKIKETHIDAQTLFIAVEQGRLDFIERCLSEGIDVDVRNIYYGNYTALHHSVESRRPNVVNFLLQHGAHPELKDAFGFTPRERAEQWGYADMVELFARSEA